MPSLKTFADKTGLPRQRRWNDVYAAVKQMPAPAPQPKPATKAPAIRKVAPEIEEVARYLVRGFHDWDTATWPPKHHYLEPGVRVLSNYIDSRTEKVISELDPEWNASGGRGIRFNLPGTFEIKKDITVKLDGLRDDWEDDFRRALDMWSKFGLNFIEVDWTPDYGRMTYLPNIIADDERAGSYMFSNFSTAIDGVGQRYVDGAPVVHTSLRKINIHKRTQERSLLRHCLHELGHALGLGHPGPYPRCEIDPAEIGAPTNCNHMGHVGMRKVPDPRIFKRDHTDNTVMSYFGGGETLGEADRVAIEMIYGG